MGRYRILYLALVLALLSGGLPQAARALENQKITLQLGWDHQFQFAGYYAAAWKGYYADAGLEVEFRSRIGPGGKFRNRIKEVVEGRADFGIGGVDLLVAKGKGVPLKVLATVFQHSGLAFYARSDKKLEKLSDLARMRVGRVRPNSRDSVELFAMLKAEGIDQQQINFVTKMMGIPDLVGDTVDVVSGYTISAGYLAGELGLTLTSLRPPSYGVDFYGDVLFTSQAVAEGDPELTRRFTEASMKGWKYALDNADEIADRISRELPRSLPVKDLMRYNRSQIKPVGELIDLKHIDIGHVNIGRWRNMYESLDQMGLIQNFFDLDDFIFDPQRLINEQQKGIMKILYAFIGAGVLLSVIVLTWTWTMRQTVIKRTAELYSEISERKEVEKELKESESFFLTAFELSPNALAITRPEDGLHYNVNRAWLSLLGYSETEVIGKTVSELGIYKSPQCRLTVMDELHKHGRVRDFEVIFKKKNDEDIFVLFSIDRTLLAGLDCNLLSYVDITERKRVQEALLASEEQYRMLVETYPQGILEIDIYGKIVFCNGALCRMLGYEIEELKAMHFVDLLPAENQDRFMAVFAKIIEKQPNPRPFFNKHVTAQGQIIDVEINWGFKRTDKGDAVGLIAIVNDITERNLIKDRLVESELGKHAVFEALDHIPFGIIIVDGNARIHFINQTAREFTDARDGLYIRNDIIMTERPGQRARLMEIINNTIESARNSYVLPNEVVALTRRNAGEPLSVIVSSLWGNHMQFSLEKIDQPLAVLFVTAPEHQLKAPAETLQHLFGMTRAEAKLTERLVAGMTLEEIAADLKITKHTTRQQLKSIFEKTGTSRQALLIKLVMSTPVWITTTRQSP